MKKIQIIPAILAHDIKRFKKQWAKVAPLSKTIQIDIMDGVLVKPKNNIKPATIKNLAKKHQLEIHLMVKDLATYMSAWSKLKNVKKIIWHYSAETETQAILCLNDFLQRKKIKTGLSLDLKNKPEQIKKVVHHFDTIQIMGVVPGKQGQKFNSRAIAKIKALRKSYPQINIEIDGGVNDQNFKQIVQAGANLIILGSSLQKTTDTPKTYRHFKNLL